MWVNSLNKPGKDDTGKREIAGLISLNKPKSNGVDSGKHKPK